MNEHQVLNLYPIDYPFETLVDRVFKDKLILDPDFQRKYKWDKDGYVRSSRFIESCLMRIPLPACYFSENEEGNHLVIDGVQRITTIKNFMDDKFRLEGLTSFKSLEGKLFSELGSYKTDIENYTIRCIILRNDNPKHLVQDIFARLNEGSVILSNQEIRHALYAGGFNDLLGELAKEHEIESFGRGKSGKQVKDSLEAEEQVLRFFAFFEDGERYDDNLKLFLDELMANMKLTSEDDISTYREVFKESLRKCIEVFGDDVFVDTSKSRPKQSLVYYDLLMKDFSGREAKFITDHRQSIKDKFEYFCNFPEHVSKIPEYVSSFPEYFNVPLSNHSRADG